MRKRDCFPHIGIVHSVDSPHILQITSNHSHKGKILYKMLFYKSRICAKTIKSVHCDNIML